MDQQLYFETNSKAILKYLTLEYGKYLTTKSKPVFGYYFPLESVPFEKLKFPDDAKIIWRRDQGSVAIKGAKYYGLYHAGLVKGIYNTKTNTVTNLIQDPSQYFNICVGVIDYLFSKVLFQQDLLRIHAACVSKGDDVLLICGAKGTGKTTLLMKFLQAGYHFIADDQVLLTFENDRLYCYPFPKTIKINHADLEKLPFLYNGLKYFPILTSYGVKKAIISPETNNLPIETHTRTISEIIVPSISSDAESDVNTIQPVDLELQHCVTDVVKQNLQFDLLIPSFKGKDLLTIDYLQDPSLTEKQELLCQKTIQAYPINIFKIGRDFRALELSTLFF